MNTRHIAMLGLAALGLALAVPAQANPNGLDGAFMLAQRDSRDEARQYPRADSRDSRNSRREAERDQPAGYGYGYERRQQQDQADDKDREPRRPRR